MSSDEEDYMSDKFLAACSDASKDVRPGLVHNKTKQREYEIEAKRARIDEEQRLKHIPVKKATEQRLQEGLSTAISSSNKGFAMLAKMGYKEGESLGKTNEGIVEPIPIAVKSDRAGIGRQAALLQLQEYRANIRKRKLEQTAEVSTEEFRRRMVQKSQAKQIEGDLVKSQRTCERLDLENEIEEPPVRWFWPERKKPKSDEEEQEQSDEVDSDEDEEDYEPAEKLEMLTGYLRTTYCYCIWCGVKYDDGKDMSDNCPGNTKDDH